MKHAALAALLGLGVLPLSGAQAGNDPGLEAQLRQVCPHWLILARKAGG